MSAPNFVITTGGEDLSSWYTEQQAADKLGLPLRTFQRLISEGKSRKFQYAPEKRERRREGKRPEPVYNPQDVDALAAAANMRVVPAGATQLLGPNREAETAGPAFRIGGQEFEAGEIPAGLQLALGVMDRLAGILERQHSPALPQIAPPPAAPEAPRVDVEKPWLLLPEASAASGLSKSLLRKLAPRIAIRDGGRWKFPRAVLADSAKLAELWRDLPGGGENEAAKDFARRYEKKKRAEAGE